MVKKSWTKKDEDLLIYLLSDGKNYKEISKILERTKNSLSNKIKRLGLARDFEWNENEINKSLSLLKNGKSFKYISETLGKSQAAVTKKMHRLGYKSEFKSNYNKGKTKYADYNWIDIQKKYNNGLSYKELLREFNLSSHAIIWAKNNGKIKMRTSGEGIKLAWKKGKFKASKRKGIERYRQLCEFKFSIKDYPEEFDFKLIEEFGWYKASNRGNNINGISRDHVVSIKFGFENDVDPKIIAHPANCMLMRHNENSSKHSSSAITVEELKKRIYEWDLKYKSI